MIVLMFWRKLLKAIVMSHDAFAPQLLAADIRVVHDLYADLFASLSDEDWQRPTEKGGWTFLETLAHLDAVAAIYQQVAEAIIAGITISFDSFKRRQDLVAWNETEIAQRTQRPISEICTSFLTTLQMVANSAAQCTPAILSQRHVFPAYNKMISLAELFGGQAAHPGLVHATQIANGANIEPLWHHYDNPLLERQLTRVLHLMALSYWPERGKMETAVNFVVARQTAWQLQLSLEGCEVGEGKAKRPSLTIWFRNYHVLCRVLTLQLSPLRATLTGQAFAWGNVPLAFRLESLFNPTNTF